MYIHTYAAVSIDTYYIFGKWKTKPGDFPNPFFFCSSCKWKFVVCPFVDDETNETYPFAHGLSGLVPLCMYTIF
jgi:hypothetical protein